MNRGQKIVFIAILSLFILSSCQKTDKNKIVMQARTTVTEINDSVDKSDSSESGNEVVSENKTEKTTSDSDSSDEAINQTEANTDESAESSIHLLEMSDKVKNGSEATLKIKGMPNTEYTIKVIYSSGASKANGLESKVSDENGYVSWTWRVGATTAEGEHEITVSGGGESIKTTFATYK